MTVYCVGSTIMINRDNKLTQYRAYPSFHIVNEEWIPVVMPNMLGNIIALDQ